MDLRDRNHLLLHYRGERKARRQIARDNKVPISYVDECF